ncbi:hypothetical protein QJQ45_014379 [Haematococcus lacustris]|nr:hypothetical protein QJQ45_014379 [Haematococcus lacustris]
MGARLLALLVATLAINAAARVEEPGNSLHLGDVNVSPQWSLELRHAAALPGSLESRSSGSSGSSGSSSSGSSSGHLDALHPASVHHATATAGLLVH